jgi:hypothetical protein
MDFGERFLNHSRALPDNVREGPACHLIWCLEQVEVSSELIQMLNWSSESGVNRDSRDFEFIWKAIGGYLIGKRRGRFLEYAIY